MALSLVFSLVLRQNERVSFAEDQSRSPRGAVMYALQEPASHNHPGSPGAIVTATAEMDNRFHNTHQEDVRIGVSVGVYALQEAPSHHTLHENIEIGEEVAVRIVADVVSVANAVGSACPAGSADAADVDSCPQLSPPSRLEIFPYLGS
jgi:hypothetical protein